MSERNQALMRTRCPVCSTAFRVTSEQLRLKAGKVRCGNCQAVFNAFDALIEDQVDSTAPAQTDIDQQDNARASEAALPEIRISPEPKDVEPVPNEAPPFVAAEIKDEAVVELLPPPEPEVQALPDVAEPAPIVAEPLEKVETTEESTLAAREAGLVAARELSDALGQSHNRWAAGTLAGAGLGGLGAEPPRRLVWPFVLAAFLLLFALAAQLLFHFRTNVVQRFPAATEWYEMAAVDVPLPQDPEFVAIDASDLQSDNARGLFVLQATLRNRAAYAQRWPALELTLTDTSDTVVARRVLRAKDYLPPATDPASFPANGEVAVKLWIEAKDIGAAGYRLYVFYP